MYFKIAPLVLTPGKNASTTSDIFIAQPDAVKESLAGKLFIIIEIESRKNENLKIINFLIDNIDHNYYQNEKILLRERISTLKVEHIFETALAKTNKNFSEWLTSEKIKIDLKSINVTAGIIYEDFIHFVNNGRNKAFLIYRHRIEDEKKTKNRPLPERTENQIEYRITDIIQQAGVDKKKIGEEKLFTNVVSGRIPNRGHFIFTNEALPEYISTKQLIKIISTLPPAGAVEQMKNTLAQINSYVSFLGIIIKSTTFEKTEKPKEMPLSTQDSIASLNKTETATENLLSSSGVASPKKWLKIPESISLKPNSSTPRAFGQALAIKDKIFVKRKASFVFLKKIYSFLKNLFSHLILGIIFIGRSLMSKEKMAGAKQILKEKISSGRQNISNWKVFNRRNKILLGLLVLFTVLFVANLFFIRTKNKRIAVSAEYNALVSEIEKQENKAEAFLLYNNEDGAKEAFAEIKRLLESLPRTNEEQEKKYNELQEKFNLQNEKVRHAIRLNSLEEIANFANLEAEAQGENIIFSPETEKIYTADARQKSIYILDLKDKSITTAADLGTSIAGLRLPSTDKENNIYYLNGREIIALGGDEKISRLTIDLKDENDDYAGAGIYNGRLYLLNKKNNEIYRYARNGQSFGAGQAWTAEKLNFSDTVGLAIDGQIYILKKNGEIIKMLKGEKQDLSLETVDPVITDATKIQVSQDLKFIYVLEPINKRLIIFDKTGKFLMQYTSDKFTKLKDFAVDEKNKILYFLNDNSILKATAEHFE